VLHVSLNTLDMLSHLTHICPWTSLTSFLSLSLYLPFIHDDDAGPEACVPSNHTPRKLIALGIKLGLSRSQPQCISLSLHTTSLYHFSKSFRASLQSKRFRRSSCLPLFDIWCSAGEPAPAA